MTEWATAHDGERGMLFEMRVLVFETGRGEERCL